MSELREMFERHQAKLLNLDYEELKQQFDHHEKMFQKRYAAFSDFENEYVIWCAAWKSRQTEIDQLKVEKEGLEKERDDAIYLKNEHRKRRCELANKLTQKSLRLTDAEIEYKRIKGLQAKDCLQIMRLTAKNERLNDELKALRGAND